MMVAGKEVTPSDVVDTARIKEYWSHGKGAALINWGVPGDFDRCLTHLGKYVHSDGMLKGLCANLHHDATGAWPGHAPGEQAGKAMGSAMDKGKH